MLKIDMQIIVFTKLFYNFTTKLSINDNETGRINSKNPSVRVS